MSSTKREEKNRNVGDKFSGCWLASAECRVENVTSRQIPPWNGPDPPACSISMVVVVVTAAAVYGKSFSRFSCQLKINCVPLQQHS